MTRALIADCASELLSALHSSGADPELQIVCVQNPNELLRRLGEQFDIVVLPESDAHDAAVVAALRRAPLPRMRIVLVARQQSSPRLAPLDPELVHGVLSRSIDAERFAGLIARIASTLSGIAGRDRNI